MYLPSIVSVSIYFEEKRALATGIAVCGSGVGMFLLAPFTEFLLHAFNWRWTLVLLGGLILNGMVFGALVRPLWGASGDAKGTSGRQIIGSAGTADDDAGNHFGSQRSRKGSEGSSIFTGNSRKDSNTSRHRSLSGASNISGNKELNAGEQGVPLMPLMEGVECITVEVIEEPVSKKSKHSKKYSVDEQSGHLLQPPQESALNFSSSPAIVS
ncbi:monocarboxylate transporter 12 [Elysia marginata]|uniref:Monocarboxylate transporter 12 n=1 Tax=Elysia marginata TaxID=1093978 RepID=A0AAV4GWU0_9GAST|nr:monocarboxylate transporter 12 [Elysia marginata]